MAIVVGCLLAARAAAQTTQPAIPAARPTTLPAVLPGNGLMQHPFFYAGEWDHRKPVQTMFVVRDGRVVWSWSIPSKDGKNDSEFSDATMLSNGNVVYACKTGAAEVTADKKVIWSYEAPKGFETHIAQPIGLDRVMLIQNGSPATLMIVNIVTGKIEKQFNLPTGSPTKTHGQFRRVRMTKAGTFLAAHMDNNKVVEYDGDGKPIWSAAIPAPWAAVRLNNGNTLVTSNKGFVRELTPAGDTVWEFTQKDAGDIKLYSIQEADRLANGDTVISNWCPNGIRNTKDWPTSVQVLEVTPEKKVVWALRSWDTPDLGPATCIQLLDEPGVAEDFGQQR